MDTRRKIIGAEEAVTIANEGATVVSGYFDPLLAASAERLAGLRADGKTLLVLIATPVNPVLPYAARAELVAGLRAVDYVAEYSGALVPHVRLEAEHAKDFSKLLDRVHACAS